MIARLFLAGLALATSTCAAAAQHHHPHRRAYHPAVAHHRVVPADAFAQVPALPAVVPLPRPRPFDAIWADRITAVVGGF